jgi:hypothetical protein
MNTNIQINPVVIPLKGEGTQIFVRTMTEGINNATGMIYWQLLTEEGSPLMDGNISLSAEQVDEWGDSMEYIENIVLDRLNLTKLANA